MVVDSINFSSFQRYCDVAASRLPRELSPTKIAMTLLRAARAVCPAWPSGVDNACSSQYFDSLFAYSLLGCFEMLSSGLSIFHCSS